MTDPKQLPEISGLPELLRFENGDAIVRSDMEYILDYCDVHLRGASPEQTAHDPDRMKGNLFLRDNREALDPLFAPYLAETGSGEAGRHLPGDHPAAGNRLRGLHHAQALLGHPAV